MLIGKCGRLAGKTPVRDHGGSVLHFYADRARAQELIDAGQVDIIGTKNRVKELRFKGPDPALLERSGSHFKRPVGTPHRNETDTNVRGVWTIPRIPESYRGQFFAVIAGQLVIMLHPGSGITEFCVRRMSHE